MIMMGVTGEIPSSAIIEKSKCRKKKVYKKMGTYRVRGKLVMIASKTYSQIGAYLKIAGVNSSKNVL